MRTLLHEIRGKYYLKTGEFNNLLHRYPYFCRCIFIHLVSDFFSVLFQKRDNEVKKNSNSLFMWRRTRKEAMDGVFSSRRVRNCKRCIISKNESSVPVALSQLTPLREKFSQLITESKRKGISWKSLFFQRKWCFNRALDYHNKRSHQRIQVLLALLVSHPLSLRGLSCCDFIQFWHVNSNRCFWRHWQRIYVKSQEKFSIAKI